LVAKPVVAGMPETTVDSRLGRGRSERSEKGGTRRRVWFSFPSRSNFSTVLLRALTGYHRRRQHQFHRPEWTEDWVSEEAPESNTSVTGQLPNAFTDSRERSQVGSNGTRGNGSD
jgi:hypothetical protein